MIYPNKERDIENFRYLGGSNFTGKVFCSTLEGHFVEASQYVKGRFIGLLEVTTRKKLAENKDSLDNLSYESIRLASAVKTRSGTYSFGESNSNTPCPYHPQYNATSCPLCLDEVLVIACRYCGRKLEDIGEICDCQRICSRCRSYPCRCCQYCHTYPCICFSSCPECRPGVCIKCTKCGRHYCFGECTYTGGGNTGGGGGGGNTGGNIGDGDNTGSGNKGNGNNGDNEKRETAGKHIIDSTDVLANKNIASFKRKAQKGNTCVPTIMEYINKLLGKENGNTRRTYTRYFKNNLSKDLRNRNYIKLKGVPTNIIPGAMLSFFGENIELPITYGGTPLDYKSCIDAGGVVMTNRAITNVAWHNILVVGYTKQGNYIYIDPNDSKNFYICPLGDLQSESTYKYNFKIKLK